MDVDKDQLVIKTVDQLEIAVDRYRAAEKVIYDYLQAPWYKRMFFSGTFLKYLISNLTRK